jgi:hypothetical protein
MENWIEFLKGARKRCFARKRGWRGGAPRLSARSTNARGVSLW